MKVYHHGGRLKHTTFAQPGGEFPVSDFMNEDGSPKLFTIEFLGGVAEVPDNLGRYLIDKGIASASPIVLLSEV